MRILITGDEGFIGTHLTKYLNGLGHQVFGMDIKRGQQEDIRRVENVRGVFGAVKPEVVIHLAALAGVRNSLMAPDKYFETNVTGTYWILLFAQQYKVKTLVASSSSVYGQGGMGVKEDMPCNHQLSPYAVSKKAMEMVCRYFGDTMPVVVFRPFTVYGENGRQDMVIGKMKKALQENTEFEQYGDGSSSRGYTNVHDLCQGIESLVNYPLPEQAFEIFNLGGAEKICLKDLVELFKSKHPELKVKVVEKLSVDPQENMADLTKIKEATGWQPKRNFREELLKII